MSKLHYAIRLTTDEALYDESYGMTETGVFCWISGNPGFTGLAANGATGEAGLTGVDYRWNEGWLPEDGVGNPTREIDIQVAGNYGAQSGFSWRLADFKAGPGSQFRKYVQDNDIKFTGRKVEMFTVIDNVFYRTWTGKVANNPETETTYEFQCDDTYKQIHTTIPPVAISESNYPNAVGNSKVIPVCFGDVPYAEAMQIEGKAERIPLAQTSEGQNFDAVPLYLASSLGYGDAGYPWDCGVTGTTVYTYDLWTYGKHFETGTMGDGTYYLNVTNGTDPVSHILSDESWIGDFPDKSQLAPIIGNSTTSGSAALPTRQSEATRICTSVPIYGHNGTGVALGPDWEWKIIVADEVLGNPQIYVVDEDRYFLSIVRLPTEWIVSNSTIHKFIPSKASHIQLFVFDSSTNLWEDISHNVLNYGTVTSEGHQAFRAPNGLVGESIIPSGVDNYSAMVLFDIPKISLVTTAGYGYAATNGNLLHDGRRSSSIATVFHTGTGTSVSTSPPPKINGTGVECLTFDIYITDELRAALDESGCQDHYLVPDFELWAKDTATRDNPGLLFQISVDPITVQGLRLDVETTNYQQKVPFPTSSYFPQYRFWWRDGGTSDLINAPMIPSKYWRSRGWDCESGSDPFGSWDNNFDEHYRGEHIIDTWGAFSFLYRDAWKLKCISDVVSDKRIQRLRVTIRACRKGNLQPSQYWQVRWFEFALVGRKSVDMEARGVYTRVAGETHLGRQTNTVYYAFRKILEGYDGIALADIDYGNLPWTRDSWHVGRQLIEQKPSFEYLQELARQSFVGIVPKRDGKRRLSAWREDTSAALQHNQTTILRAGMQGKELTPLNQVYNQFDLKYSWDPGAKQYVRSLYVRKTTEASFPELSGAWGEYVGSSILSKDDESLSGDFSSTTAYPDCKAVWDICHDSWDRIKVSSGDPGTDYTELPWYIDYSEFDPESGEYQGIDSSAWKYLRNFAQWSTRQKTIVRYKLPITAANMTIELLDPVDFTDTVWTAGETRNGWVVGIEVDTENDCMIITSILEPPTIAVDSDEFIEEIGSVIGAYISDPTYTESGTADTITETGVS
jgi:hypothetical protein